MTHSSPASDTRSIRAFLAVEISEEMRQGVANVRGHLEKGAAFTGAAPVWTRPEAMHLTIKFLGNIAPADIERIAGRLRPACARLAPFSYGARGLGVFPGPDRPRVIWIGIKRADEAFARLHTLVEGEMAALGFPPEERPFKPHLTLARLKSGRGAQALMKIVATHGRDWCGEARAERLTLFHSVLRPDGAQYSRLREFPFEAPESAHHGDTEDTEKENS